MLGQSLLDSGPYHIPARAYGGPGPARELAKDPLPRPALFLVCQQALLVQVWLALELDQRCSASLEHPSSSLLDSGSLSLKPPSLSLLGGLFLKIAELCSGGNIRGMICNKYDCGTLIEVEVRTRTDWAKITEDLIKKEGNKGLWRWHNGPAL